MAKHTVLVVDDEEDLRKVLAIRLNMENYEVTEAASAEEALKITEQKSFDIILLDIIMPGMDGIELYNCLKKRKHLANSGYIFLTALGEREQNQHTDNASGKDYLVIGKPYDSNILLQEIKNRIKTP